MRRRNPALQVSKRASLTPPSPIRKLVPLADRAKSQGVKIFYLNIGQPDIKSPPSFLKAVREFRHPVVAYENSQGNPLLREELVKYYKRNGISLKSKEIIVTTGGSEAILFALMAVCDPGDQCLIPEPCYANYMGFASMAGVTLVPIPTDPKNGFHLPDMHVWEKARTEKTRALVVVNPNNPTGTVYDKRELAMLDQFARSHKLFVISDETYREMVYDGAVHHSFLNFGSPSQHVILVDSLSKRYSLCGARIGCLVAHNKSVLESVTKFCQARLAAPTIEQEAAIAAVKSPKRDIEKIRSEFMKRRDTVISSLQNIPGVFVRKPEGAFYCVAKLPVNDAEAFSSWLLTDFRDRGQTLMLAPANGFYLTQNGGLDEVRIAYVLKSEDLKRSMALLKTALAVYPKKSTASL